MNGVTKKEKLPPIVSNESGSGYAYSDAVEDLDEIIRLLIRCYAYGSECTNPEEISNAHYCLASIRYQFRDMAKEHEEKKAPAKKEIPTMVLVDQD